MPNKVTSEEVAQQFARAIQLLLDWTDSRIGAKNMPPPNNGPATDNNKFDDNVLLRAGEVAGLLKISKSQAFNLISRGVIPSIRFGRSIRVRAKDLTELIEKRS
jgi:excisionase family DNA binding protein